MKKQNKEGVSSKTKNRMNNLGYCRVSGSKARSIVITHHDAPHRKLESIR
ncbi:MAG: hypothetical protein FWG14_13750 [Peptococcaceae bacterium]|nr:hypothetical protein [Peptococcaceae bacterium]